MTSIPITSTLRVPLPRFFVRSLNSQPLTTPLQASFTVTSPPHSPLLSPHKILMIHCLFSVLKNSRNWQNAMHPCSYNAICLKRFLCAVVLSSKQSFMNQTKNLKGVVYAQSHHMIHHSSRLWQGSRHKIGWNSLKIHKKLETQSIWLKFWPFVLWAKTNPKIFLICILIMCFLQNKVSRGQNNCLLSN